jgi:tRNA-modifying protein YgfZ
VSDAAARIRRGAGWFALPERGLLCVRGADRVRWTNGMVSNDVASLAPGPDRSGCHALLLTAQGRIVADLHVLAREDELWLELAGDVLPDVAKRLERYVIADDVRLSDESAHWCRFALEGPHAPELLARAVGAPIAIARDSGADVVIAGAPAVACAWGWSGEAAYQLFVPTSAAETVERAIAAAAREGELESGDAETLEVLRIEAGTPRQGRELDEDVLPAEAGLVGRAVSTTKGCYTGQEIVARMESRGSASHRLVGLHCDAADADPPRVGAAVQADDQTIGAVTSACRSSIGAIALGYLRSAHAAPGTAVDISGVRAHVAALPFVPGRAVDGP